MDVFFFPLFLCVLFSYIEILAFKKYFTIEKFNTYMHCIPDLDSNIYICTYSNGKGIHYEIKRREQEELGWEEGEKG